MDVIFRGESDAVDRVLILSITAVRMSVTQRCQLYTFSWSANITMITMKMKTDVPHLYLHQLDCPPAGHTSSCYLDTRTPPGSRPPDPGSEPLRHTPAWAGWGSGGRGRWRTWLARLTCRHTQWPHYTRGWSPHTGCCHTSPCPRGSCRGPAGARAAESRQGGWWLGCKGTQPRPHPRDNPSV